MQVIQIDERGEAILVQSPYHPAFIKKARDLHGKWIDPAWVFDRRNRDYVEETLRQVYGYASMEEVGATVTLRMNLSYFDDGPALYFLGRLICQRKARDYRVRLGDDVIVVEGGFPSSGGSVKNPRCAWKEDTIVELKDVPRVLWDRLEDRWKAEAVQLVESPPTPSVPASTCPRSASGIHYIVPLGEDRVAVARHTATFPSGTRFGVRCTLCDAVGLAFLEDCKIDWS